MTQRKEPPEVDASRGFDSVETTSGKLVLPGDKLFKFGSYCQTLSFVGFGRGTGGEGQGEGACAPPSPASGFPSLSYIKQLNNSGLKPDPVSLPDYEEAGKVPRRRSGSHWCQDGEGGGAWWGHEQTSAEHKRAFRLVENLTDMGREYGTETLGFLTLTFVENLTDPKEAQRRFNSLLTNVLRKLFPDYVIVLEPQKRGAIHYHLVVYCALDIKTGFDFNSVAQGSYKSANPALRDLWKTLREAMPNYGFGRSELLPVRTTEEGIAKYVGGYLQKGTAFKGPQYKGMRTVRYRQRPRIVGPRFSWVVQGFEWRQTVSTIARLAGVSGMDGMKEKYGKHWAFWLRLALQSASQEEIPDVELLRRFELYAFASGERPEEPPPAPIAPPPFTLPASYPPRAFSQADFLDMPGDLDNLLKGDSFRWFIKVDNPF